MAQRSGIEKTLLSQSGDLQNPVASVAWGRQRTKKARYGSRCQKGQLVVFAHQQLEREYPDFSYANRRKVKEILCQGSMWYETSGFTFVVLLMGSMRLWYEDVFFLGGHFSGIQRLPLRGSSFVFDWDGLVFCNVQRLWCSVEQPLCRALSRVPQVGVKRKTWILRVPLK